MTKWNHNFGRQLRLLMQHLETKQRSDSGADAEDTEHIRQVHVAANRCRNALLTCFVSRRLCRIAWMAFALISLSRECSLSLILYSTPTSTTMAT